MPELALVIPALVALLIVLGWEGWTVKVLQAAKAHAPGLFGPLFDALISADSAIYNTLRAWADPAVRPFSDAVDSVAGALRELITNPLAFARSVSAALDRAFNVAIPGAVTEAINFANAALNNLRAWAEGEVQGVQQVAAGLAADLAGLGQRLDLALGQLLALILHTGSQVSAYALGLFTQAEQDFARGVAVEAERAQQAEAEVAAAVEAEAARAEAEVQAWAQAVRVEVGQIAHSLESDVLQARTDLGNELHGFEDTISKAVEDVINGSPLKLAEALGDAGKRALAADVEALVTVSAAEIRKQLRDVEALRARFGPQVTAAGRKARA